MTCDEMHSVDLTQSLTNQHSVCPHYHCLTFILAPNVIFVTVVNDDVIAKILMADDDDVTDVSG